VSDAAGALAPAAVETLGRLAAGAWAADFYLAGGAALAARLGHRAARDLDLMSATERLLPAGRRDLLQELLSVEPAARVETARDGFLFVRFPDQVGVRFYWYPYPLAEPPTELAGFAVASLVDLALMKLGAVISRGTRRDFVDLYCIGRELPLAGVLARAGDKFGHVGDFALQAAKALADFSEAEDEPKPRLAESAEWGDVRAWAMAEAARLGREALGA
jgi:hypothetical protein